MQTRISLKVESTSCAAVKEQAEQLLPTSPLKPFENVKHIIILRPCLSF